MHFFIVPATAKFYQLTLPTTSAEEIIDVSITVREMTDSVTIVVGALCVSGFLSLVRLNIY